MKSYKDPPLEERLGRAATAKSKALEQLRSRPPVDAAAVAERQAVRAARDLEKRERRAAKISQAAVKEVTEEAPPPEPAPEAPPAPAPSDAERKAARDARYAARKSRR